MSKPEYVTEIDPALTPDRGPLQELHSGPDWWAGPGFSGPPAEPDPAAEPEAG